MSNSTAIELEECPRANTLHQGFEISLWLLKSCDWSTKEDNSNVVIKIKPNFFFDYQH